MFSIRTTLDIIFLRKTSKVKYDSNKKILIAKLSSAQLNSTQFNSNSVGWAEIALISTFNPHPQGKYREGYFNTVIDQI